jgi:hypothetical protein
MGEEVRGIPARIGSANCASARGSVEVLHLFALAGFLKLRR